MSHTASADELKTVLNIRFDYEYRPKNVIVLSDSDEAGLLDNRNKSGSDIKRKYDSDTAINLDLPKICYHAAEDSASRSKEDFSANLNANSTFKVNPDRLLHAMSNSCDSEDDQINRTSQIRTISGKSKTMLKEHRLRRRHVLARAKALKAITLKRSKDMKPGECLKFMEVNLDRAIVAFAFQAEVKNVLRNANIKFNITDQFIPNSITWQRNVEEHYVTEDNEIRTKRIIQVEKHVLLIWSTREAVTHVAEDTFCSFISNIKDMMSNYNMSLIIFGMEEYFTNCQKKQKSNRTLKNKRVRCSSVLDQQFDALPIISRQQLEMCLTEVQIVARCSTRLIENVEDIPLIIYQYTKSISEVPYKLQKRQNQECKFDWYAMGDNKNTVCIDKHGNGLKRLWQQQLCQFNLSSLEIAETICMLYSSPVQLIEAYKSRTPDEGINLLKDVPIRRAAGPLTTIRKVGPELSKKIYTMFMSQNGDMLLGIEE